MKLSVLAAVAIVGAVDLSHAALDAVTAASEVPCDEISARSLGMGPWRRAEAAFGIPIYEWTPSVWDSFRNRALQCFSDGKAGQFSSGETVRSLKNIIDSHQRSNKYEIDTAIEKRRVQQVEEGAAIRRRAAEASESERRRLDLLATINSAIRVADASDLSRSELEAKAQSIMQLIERAGATASNEQRSAIPRIQERIRKLQLVEADQWERLRPEREAKAKTENEELTRLERINSERAAADAADRERAAKLEQARRASEKIDADKNARLEREKLERVQAESQIAMLQKQAEEEKTRAQRLSADRCNKIEAKSGLMRGVNGLPALQMRGISLIDIQDGENVSDNPTATSISCRYHASWSNGERNIVTIKLSQNSVGEDIIELNFY